jgi:hypothetical protein
MPKGRTLSYQELMARREKRKLDELEFAMRRPKLTNNASVNLQILIYQWMIDELFKSWRRIELEKSQAQKVVLKAQKTPGRRGGRKSSVLEQLGLK